MSTLVKFLRKNLRHVFLLTMTVALTWIVTSCETEYIPDNPDVEEPTFSVTEGNFGIEMHFATFGEEEEHSSDTHSLLSSEQIAAGRNMEPETNVIRVKDDLFIYATLSVDNADKAPNDKAPAVKTRAFNPGANIRIAIYDSSTITSAFTKLDEILYRDSLGELVRADGSGFKIQLNDGYYKLIAYSYNTTTPPPSADLAGDLINVDSGNDLIWGESPTVLISGNSVTGIPITMYHKMSQVKLVAKMADGSTGIYGFGGGVSMQGYAADLATFTGVMSKNSTVATPLAFTFPTVAFPVVSVTSATRTVYTDGDIPTIIRIGTLSIGSGGTIDTTITNIPATFAKSLLSGYSYTMTMNIGESPDITDDEPPQGFVPYVGAFWRASQTGERLLRMKVTTGEADSVWTARVIEGGDWIMLDKGQSADPNVGNPSAAIDTTTSFGNLYKLDPGSASDFVSGFATMNPGEDEIYFRIGLRSTLPGGATAAPRYGVVLLTYGNNRYRHRIWIRQGEGDDFLMRNSDPLTGGNRTLAARFSPFNLTANALPEYAGTPTSVQVGLNGGNFVKFPTQGGTFWYWATDAANATTYLRRAYHPGNPLNYSGSTPPWLADNLDTGNDTWDEANNSETCPSGYRRPNDGATNAAVPSPAINSSEIRQSLWLNPPTGDNDNTDNSVWGYYADGYFDRYGIETTLSGGGAVAHDFAPQTAVTPLTKNAAYMGRLVYNPNNLASLFFPAAGHRGSGEVNPAGELLGAGNGGYYWTSTASNVTTGTYWALYFVAGGYDVPPELSQKTLAANNKAMSIRCVKTEVPPVPPMPDIQDAPYVWVGAFWKYNQRGERLIRWSNTGPWTATVTAGGTDIIMDQSLPANTAVEWLPNPTGTLISGNDPSFETNYQVPGNQQTVSGNGAIYFRIGWKTALTNPTAHRYGKITVTYANGTRTQDIYLRQGEYPDYIISGRNNSKAFAAYNLTYDNDIWNVGTGTALTDHPQLGVGGGTFVDYPTQAGAYFQWALPSGNAALRRAFHPVTPNTDEITGWEAFNSPPLWNDVSSINETCPSLYRRPNDGSTSAQETNSNPNTNVSEMRQSLYASMPTGTGESSSNSVYGYYADGFYDRRKLLSYQAVSNTNSQVAYVGMLFFNANDNKSIFFPSAGERDWQRGQRNQPGGAALYWSSSSVDASTRPNAWILYAANGQRLQWTHDKNSALSIRCVLITNP